MRNETFGRRIKRLRTEQNLNAADLAYLAKTSQPCVSKWERDIVVPSVFSAADLARALNVTLDYLVYGTQPDQTRK